MTKKQKIFLILFGISLAFIFGELILRIIGFSGGIYVLDKETRLTTLKPNQQFYWIKDCFKNLVKTNSLGFHDFEFNEEKANGIFRIAIVGDSYVEALQVPREKSFHNLLENKLNQEANGSRKFEVYAFGHSGNGTLLNYFYVKNYGLKHKPDLVIDAFLIGNDFRDDSYKLTQKYVEQTGDTIVYQHPFPIFDNKGNIDFGAVKNEFLKIEESPRSLIRNIASKSVFAVWLYQKYQLVKANPYSQKKSEIKQKNAKSEGVIDEIPVDYQVFLKDYPDIWNNSWKIEKQLIETMKKMAEENNSRFIVVSLTEGFRIHNNLDLNKEYSPYVFELDKPERLLKEITDELKIPYLALTPIFIERAIENANIQTTFPCDGHWNEIGHQWAADAIFDFLKNHSDLLISAR